MISIENIMPSGKLENTRKAIVNPPTIKPYIHCPGFDFGPEIGSVTMKIVPNKNEPESSMYRGEATVNGFAICNIILKKTPPRRHDPAKRHEAAFLYIR